MREKIQRFMIGRYGADELAKAQSIAALVLLFLSMFSRLGIFYWLAIALMISLELRRLYMRISAFFPEIFSSVMQKIRNISTTDIRWL